MADTPTQETQINTPSTEEVKAAEVQKKNHISILKTALTKPSSDLIEYSPEDIVDAIYALKVEYLTEEYQKKVRESNSAIQAEYNAAQASIHKGEATVVGKMSQWLSDKAQEIRDLVNAHKVVPTTQEVNNTNLENTMTEEVQADTPVAEATPEVPEAGVVGGSPHAEGDL